MTGLAGAGAGACARAFSRAWWIADARARARPHVCLPSPPRAASIAHRFSGDSYDRSYKQTIGLDFFIKQVELPGVCAPTRMRAQAKAHRECA